MRYIKRVLAIAACLCLILSFSILTASAEGVPTEVSLNLEGFPYNDEGATFFANGVYLLADTYKPIYFEMYSTDTSGRIGNNVNPGCYFVEKSNDSGYLDYLFTPYVKYNEYTGSYCPISFRFYDENGNNIYCSAGGLTYTSQNSANSSDLSYPGFDAPVVFYGSYKNYVDGYSLVSDFTKSNGMLYIISTTHTLTYPSSGTLLRFGTLYELPVALNLDNLNDNRPTLTINGDVYYTGGSASGDKFLTVVGNIEPVTDADGNITNYIINNEIDISPLTESDEDPRDPHSLNSSELDELESGLMSEDVTIPEFDSSLVDGSGTYWNMVEQLLDTSGLKPVVLFALAVGLASFIIGRKT